MRLGNHVMWFPYWCSVLSGVNDCQRRPDAEDVYHLDSWDEKDIHGAMVGYRHQQGTTEAGHKETVNTITRNNDSCHRAGSLLRQKLLSTRMNCDKSEHEIQSVKLPLAHQ